MSGGSMDYAYLKVYEAAERIDAKTDDRARLREHLRKVAEALRCIEWTDSGDGNFQDENEAIRKCFKEGAW